MKMIKWLTIPAYWLGFAGGLLAWSAAGAEEPLHHVSAEVCQQCHQDIYKQWKGSMHAQSNALTDPIHATFYKKVVGDPTKEGVKHKASGKFPVCLNCHAPNAARDKTTKLDAKPAYMEGVNCVACHTLGKYNGIDRPDGKFNYGIKAYDLTETVQGPQGFNRGVQELTAGADPFGGAATGSDDSKPNPHIGEDIEIDGKAIPQLPLQGNPTLMKTNDACMGCHDKRNNPHGVALCQTGDEYVASKSQVNCIACHMPISNGIADHSMGGGHDKGMLKRAVLFLLDTQAEGEVLKTKVTLTNQQPHSLPTGAPFRNIYLKLMAYNESGEVVWENAEGHPAKADPKAYMAYLLADDAGKNAMPPDATQLGEDSRLKPHETRVLEYDIPANDVVLVRGELYYNLLWPVLVENFKHLPDDLKAPQLIAAAETKL